MSFSPLAQPLSTRPLEILVITVIVCILWTAVPQVQEVITSLIVLNALWVAQLSVRIAGWTVPGGAAMQRGE